MKRNTFFIVLAFILMYSTTFSQTSKMRGTIIDVEPDRYRYDYYDVSEDDSHYAYLEELGYQGGGPSWEGIIFGLLQLKHPAILKSIEFDAEGEGIAIWSSKRDYLMEIAQLVTQVKKDNALLKRAIQVAEENDRME